MEQNFVHRWPKGREPLPVSTVIIGVVGLFKANHASDKQPANLLLVKTRPHQMTAPSAPIK